MLYKDGSLEVLMFVKLAQLGIYKLMHLFLLIQNANL